MRLKQKGASLKKLSSSVTMSTPVFSKKQQRKALSGKKGPAKGLRNVLAQPYEFSWPNAKNEHVDEIKILLEKSMPALRRPSLDIPWAKLHKMKKEERQEARKEARLKLEAPLPDENILNSVVMGVNAVTRLLEQDNALCVILEANIEPMLMIKHVVTMADLRSVSVLLLPCLKNVMLEAVGFACAAIALKKTVAASEAHHFYNLYKKVVEFAESLDRSRPLRLDVESAPVRESVDDENTIISSKLGKKEEKVVPKKLFTISTDVYMYRKSRKERIFVPEGGTGSELVGERIGGDFISIGKDLGFEVDDNTSLKSKKKIRYVDIHEEDENFFRVGDDCMQVDDVFSVDTNPKVSNRDSEILYETKSKVFGTREKSPADLGNKKVEQNFRYHSLKVKRLQGNPKRLKATKVPKKNRK